MTPQFQYQRYAKPVPVPGEEAETPQLDKWFSPPSQPGRNYAASKLRTAFLVAALPFFFFQPPQEDPAQAVVHGPTSQPIRPPRAKPHLRVAFFMPEAPQETHQIQPLAFYPDRTTGRVRVPHLRTALTWYPDTPAAAPSVPDISWLQAQEPQRPKRGVPWRALSTVSDPTPVPVPDVSSWGSWLAQVRSRVSTREYRALFFVDAPAAPTLPDLPLGLGNQPTPGRRDLRYTYPSVFYGAPPIAPPVAPPVDGWYRPSELRPPRAFRSGYLLAGGYLVPQDFAPAPPPAPAPATTVKPMQGEATERIFAQVPEVATGQVVADSKQTIRAAVPEASSGSLGT